MYKNVVSKVKVDNNFIDELRIADRSSKLSHQSPPIHHNPTILHYYSCHQLFLNLPTFPLNICLSLLYSLHHPFSISHCPVNTGNICPLSLNSFVHIHFYSLCTLRVHTDTSLLLFLSLPYSTLSSKTKVVTCSILVPSLIL